jgi:hypothetical protein
MPTYAIIYATASKALRRIISTPEGLNGTEVGTTHPLLLGESVLYVSTQIPHTIADWNAAVKASTGVSPPVLTCALVDGTNTVTDIINADPAIDAAPAGFTMVQCYDPGIGPGCTYDTVGKLFTKPAITIPANTKYNPTALPVVIPAVVIARPIPPV